MASFAPPNKKDMGRETAAADAASSSSSSATAPLVIIGSGPCGLGAAYRLQELGYENFLVLEAGAEAGGLSITATDDQGFLWDMGTFLVVHRARPITSTPSPTHPPQPPPQFHSNRWPRHFFPLPVL